MMAHVRQLRVPPARRRRRPGSPPYPSHRCSSVVHASTQTEQVAQVNRQIIGLPEGEAPTEPAHQELRPPRPESDHSFVCPA